MIRTLLLGFAFSRCIPGHGPLPAHLSFFVLLPEPFHQWFKVGDQRPGRQTLARGLAEDGIPISGRAGAEDSTQEISHLGVAIIITLARILLEDLTGDVVVKLKLDDSADR